MPIITVIHLIVYFVAYLLGECEARIDRPCLDQTALPNFPILQKILKFEDLTPMLHNCTEV